MVEYQFTLVKIVWLTVNSTSLPLPSFMSFVSHIGSPGRDQTSESEVCFLMNTYCLSTTSKSRKNLSGTLINWEHQTQAPDSLRACDCFSKRLLNSVFRKLLSSLTGRGKFYYHGDFIPHPSFYLQCIFVAWKTDIL